MTGASVLGTPATMFETTSSDGLATRWDMDATRVRHHKSKIWAILATHCEFLLSRPLSGGFECCKQVDVASLCNEFATPKISL
jgi:hypothetical protein